MHKVLLLGVGKIGRMAAALLSASGDYDVLCADIEASRLRCVEGLSGVSTATIDVRRDAAVAEALRGRDAVLCTLSFHHNRLVAEAALRAGVSYFDVTEDVATAREIRALAGGARAGQVFMPQGGLAPGFVSIVANHLARAFDRLDSVHMRVGALPQFPSNALRYNLTWSTDGLINEYCNPCDAIVDGQLIEVLPLEGLEHLWLDGVQYEAFNTSGGVGSLCESFAGRVRELDYKTLRHPGHRDLVAFLIRDLRLGERRDLLKDVLEHAIPATSQDLVAVFCTASGWRADQLQQISDARVVYSQQLFGEDWSAIQISTAASLCAALDLKLTGKLPATGFVAQERIDLDDFLANRFGCYYTAAPPPTAGPRKASGRTRSGGRAV